MKSFDGNGSSKILIEDYDEMTPGQVRDNWQDLLSFLPWSAIISRCPGQLTIQVLLKYDWFCRDVVRRSVERNDW